MMGLVAGYTTDFEACPGTQGRDGVARHDTDCFKDHCQRTVTVVISAKVEAYDILVYPPSMQVAGASAAAGDDLATVLAKARATAHSVGSMGVATSVCTVPGSKPQEPSR